MFGGGEGNGEGFLSVACLPWESLCCFEGEVAGLSLWWLRDRVQQHLERKGGGSVSLLLCSWFYRTSPGSAEASWNPSIPELQAGKEEREIPTGPTGDSWVCCAWG